MGFWSNLTDSVGGALGDFADACGETWSNVVDNTQEAVYTATDAVGAAGQTVVDTVTDATRAALDTLGRAAGRVFDTVESAAQWVREGVEAAWDTINGILRSWLNSFGVYLDGVLEDLLGLPVKLLVNAINAGTSTFSFRGLI